MPDRTRRLLVLGGALAALPAIAQPGRTPRLGLLLLTPNSAVTDPFVAGLKERGWEEGRNLALETRFTASRQDQAGRLAGELLLGRADVLVAVSTANALAARQATSTVPIVMLGGGYPVEAGLAKSLARPGGNVTGISIYAQREVFGKFVALAKELLPSLRDLGVLWGYGPPAFPQIEADITLAEMRRAAAATRIRLHEWMNRSQADLDANLAAAATAALGALFVTSGAPQAAPGNVEKIAQLCRARRLPSVCDVSGAFFQRAGVLAYSADLNEIGARAASFVDRILRGADPAELPMEQPTKFNLIVNLKQARAIAMSVPTSILARADRVIE